MKRVLILHGWGGSDYPHWQSWLAGELAKDYGCVCFPLLHSPHFPGKNRQMKQIKEIMNSFQPQIVICHSLANTLWFHLCEEGEIPTVDHLLMVAPPSNNCDIHMIRKFFPAPLPKNVHAKEVFLVASTDDPCLSTDEAENMQKELGIEMLLLKNAGHINEKSGYGPWPWVLEWVKERMD